MWRGSIEYMDGALAFVKFASENSTRKEYIVCPCKKCSLGRTLWSDVVYDHLTLGAGILKGYTEWILHGEPTVASMDREATHEGPNMAHVDSMPVKGGSNGMQDMLNDIFAMHNVRVEEGGPQVGMDAEIVEAEMEDSNVGARKLYDLLQEADTPLHANTKHSKLGLSCVYIV
ncbi:hypothetical protein SLA2020_280730 [Shorea laevis]